MLEVPSVLVDSNVIIDIVQKDPKWVEWSLDSLSRFEATGVNPIIYAELCYQRTESEEVDDLLKSLDIGYYDLPRPSLYLASQAFRIYREQGGVKSAPLPDFFIGAHAAMLGVPIITRDVARYQTYFPNVRLIFP